MRRRERPEDRRPVRPPRELLEPFVEDFVDLDEQPRGGSLSAAYRLPAEDDGAWAFRRLADQRYVEALAAFQTEHRGQRLDMSVAERRRWLLGEGPRWRRSPA